jgi:hypothetical protein
MKHSERVKLLRELQQIQNEVPSVVVQVDVEAELEDDAQNRANEIQRMLLADAATRIPPAELEE